MKTNIESRAKKIGVSVCTHASFDARGISSGSFRGRSYGALSRCSKVVLNLNWFEWAFKSCKPLVMKNRYENCFIYIKNYTLRKWSQNVENASSPFNQIIACIKLKMVFLFCWGDNSYSKKDRFWRVCRLSKEENNNNNNKTTTKQQQQNKIQ